MYAHFLVDKQSSKMISLAIDLPQQLLSNLFARSLFTEEFYGSS